MDPTEAPERRPMDTGLLAAIAAGGVLIGLLSSFGALPGTSELVVWVVVATAALIATLRRIPRDAFRHLGFGLMLTGFIAADVKVLFWRRFLDNHPEMVETAMANGLSQVPRTAIIISDTVTGALFGLVAGLIALYLTRRRGRPVDAPPSDA